MERTRRRERVLDCNQEQLDIQLEEPQSDRSRRRDNSDRVRNRDHLSSSRSNGRNRDRMNQSGSINENEDDRDRPRLNRSDFDESERRIKERAERERSYSTPQEIKKESSDVSGSSRQEMGESSRYRRNLSETSRDDKRDMSDSPRSTRRDVNNRTARSESSRVRRERSDSIKEDTEEKSESSRSNRREPTRSNRRDPSDTPRTVRREQDQSSRSIRRELSDSKKQEPRDNPDPPRVNRREPSERSRKTRTALSRSNSEVDTERTLVSNRTSPIIPLRQSPRSSATGRIRQDTGKWESDISLITDFISKASALKIGALFNDDQLEAVTNFTNDSTVPDLNDPLTLNSLIVQATADTEGFVILSPDRYLDKKKKLVQISNNFESIQNKLSLECKVKEATENVIKYNSDDPKQVEEAKMQLLKTEKKMKDLTSALWVVIGDLIAVERSVLKHLGGALRWKVVEHSLTMSNAPTVKLKPSEAELKRKLSSSEERIKEMEAQINILKNTVSRLENEQVPLRELASDAQREARKAREDRDAVKRSLNAGSTTQPSPSEYNKVKLDYATTKAELIDVKEELEALKDSQANLQLQLEEDQALIQSKDRMIANLLSELEEASAKMELSRAGGMVSDFNSPTHPSLGRMMGRKNAGRDSPGYGDSEKEQMQSVIASQLKEAVLERERLKLRLEEEVERRLEIEKKMEQSDKMTVSSVTDTESERRGGRLRTRRTPQTSRAGSSVDVSKVNELEEEIRNLQEIVAKAPSEADIGLLEKINTQLENELDLTPRQFSFSLLDRNFSRLIELLSSTTSKLKSATREIAFLEDEKVRLAREMEQEMKNQGNSFESLEVQHQKLEADYKDLTRKLERAEKEAARVLELQELIDDQAVELKRHISEKEKDLAFHHDELSRAKSSYQQDIAQLKRDHQSEIDTLAQKLKDNIRQLQKELEDQRSSFESRLKSEVEWAKLSHSEDLSSQHEQKLRKLEDKHKSQIEELKAIAELEKSTLNATFQKERLESQSRLDIAEQALVDSRQQFFNEKEQLLEKIELVQGELEEFKAKSKSSIDEWSARKAELQAAIDKLHDEADSQLTKLNEANRKLELKSREANEIQGLHEIELKNLQQQHQGQIVSFEGQIAELHALIEELKMKNEQTLQQVGNSQQEIQQIKDEYEVQKAKISKDLQKAQEATDDATDQLSRVQRLLKEVNSDVERYRRLADERDNEILTLKRTLRQKEKELTEGAMANTSDSSQLRKILDQKDNEIDSLKAEVRTFQSEIAALQRKLEVKDREIEDTKNQMRRNEGADKDEQSEELNRLQLMLFELKTTRADLLEQLDDAQHEAETLRQQLKKLQESQN